MWFGLQCSIRPAVSLMTLNADITAIAVYQPGKAFDLARKLAGNNWENFTTGRKFRKPEDFTKLSKAFRGVKVCLSVML